jgi:hypothetical protein
MAKQQMLALQSGAPLLIQYAYPLADLEHLKAALGITTPGSLTLKNLTLNCGLRSITTRGVPAERAGDPVWQPELSCA